MKEEFESPVYHVHRVPVEKVRANSDIIVIVCLKLQNVCLNEKKVYFPWSL